MTLKVCIAPDYSSRPDRADGGIRRVTEAMRRYLPEFGVEVVARPEGADVLNSHGTSLVEGPGKPMVATCHGLHWAEYAWESWADDVNAQVVEVLRRGDAHTAPSEWVSAAMRRGMLIYPEVVYHGVDADEWEPAAEPGRYVLWNKARQDPVSDPAHMQELARHMPSTPFVSTLGQAAANVRLCGVVPYDAMRELVRGAGVYLATARETFGIGTLEALAAGVPVAGWAYGGQAEIVIQGDTGYLAPFGDYAALAECVARCIAERPRLSANARQDALARWGWRPRIRQYAELFRRVHGEHTAQRPLVSVVVTSHNLGRYLAECLDSVLAQSLADWECLIVDDWSDDDTGQIAAGYCGRDARFAYHRTPANLKLSGARNYGAVRARGRYLLFLDADDMLAPEALGLLARHLDRAPETHVAFGHLDVVDVDGANRRRNPWPYASYNWRMQMAHLNQLPYSAMMRRNAFVAGGGYRRRAWRAEDAEMWCRLTSFGFRVEKATEASTLIYRDRPDSKSKGEPGDGDWTAWFPWRVAGNIREAGQRRAQLAADGPLPNAEIVPWGAQGKPPKVGADAKMRFWRVPHRADPFVSVVIPVGRGHERLVIDSLDSLVAQDFGEWEAIVVNDTGAAWADGLESPVAGAPFARVLDACGPVGAGKARNLGAAHARGETLLFLDADDYLLPGALALLAAAYRERPGVIYGDWLRNDGDGAQMRLYEAENFVCGDVLRQMRHSVTALVPLAAHRAVGGFDETFGGWEDWDYFIGLQAHGLCSTRVAAPTFVYRFRAGTRRESSFGDKDRLLKAIRAKWSNYYDGRTTMSCARCPGGAYKPGTNGTTNGQAKAPTLKQLAAEGDAVLLEYQGANVGPLSYRGPASGKTYRFGQDEFHRRAYVLKPDAAHLLGRSVRGTREFVLAGETLAAVPAPTLPETAKETARPEFPAMPVSAFAADANGATAGETESMTVMEALLDPGGATVVFEAADALPLPETYRRIRDAAPDVSVDTLAAWLAQEERAEKPRISVVKLLRRALELAGEHEPA